MIKPYRPYFSLCRRMKQTFKTSDKTPEKVVLRDEKMTKMLSRTEVYSQTIKGDVLMSSSNDNVLRTLGANGLVGTLFKAYNGHHNVVLRPEHFWVAILTQFSQFVNFHSEKLRDTFVNFQGKKELNVTEFGSLRTANYDQIAVKMTKQISDNLKDASIRDWVLPSFSTTTSNDTVVCSVVMMAAMQKYFSYKATLCCGIPSVTLLGAPEDYEEMAKRVDRLPEFDAGTGLMIKWHKLLRPIFTELINASRDNANPEFWSKVCNHHGGGSGPSYLSGWVTAFCCFDDEGKWRGDQLFIVDWKNKKTSSEYPVIDTNDIPSGLVSVPITIDDNGVEYKARMVSGSFSAGLVDEFTLSPRLDWCISLESPAK